MTGNVSGNMSVNGSVSGLNLSMQSPQLQLGCNSPNNNNNNNNNNNLLSNHMNSLNHLSSQLMSTPQSQTSGLDVPGSASPCSDPSKALGKLDLGESCLFCSRSLVNLSNFNKRIHIETCKIKTLKKATNKLRQTASPKAARKRPIKKEKIDSANSSINSL